jgi:hypothetical protein
MASPSYASGPLQSLMGVFADYDNIDIHFSYKSLSREAVLQYTVSIPEVVLFRLFEFLE